MVGIGSFRPVLLAPGTPLPQPSSRAGDGTAATVEHDQVFVRGQQISRSSSGVEANRPCEHPAISDNARFTAFDTTSSNLLWWEFHGARQVYCHDAESGNTCMVSIGDAGQQANEDCAHPDVSNDGRFTVFLSKADNLLPARWLVQHTQVYLHDSVNHQTILLSRQESGRPIEQECTAVAISEDGHAIRYAVDGQVYEVANPLPDMQSARKAKHDMDVLKQAVKSGVPGSITEDAESVEIGNLRVRRPR